MLFYYKVGGTVGYNILIHTSCPFKVYLARNFHWFWDKKGNKTTVKACMFLVKLYLIQIPSCFSYQNSLSKEY